mgnify:CR=1 FL=1|tara:strand:+ start:100 stop:291 length:192 start_codon:yes stop_codon:yes gene_type:complete
MTVKELIKELKKHPENMDVFVAERKTEFTYGLVNTISKKEIDFTEEPDGEVFLKDNVIVIHEE